MNSNNIYLEDKYDGAFLGAAIGDVLGWPQEYNSNNINKNNDVTVTTFIDWKRRTGGRYYLHEDIVLKGEYSDDTQLLISTARSLLQGNNWAKFFVKVELPSWLLYERGGGGATLRAARSWSRGIPPWQLNEKNSGNVKRYFHAGGNGVAMRIMPHVFHSLIHGTDMNQQIILNGIYTHGHPRALLGALIYGKALEIILTTEGSLEYGELIGELIDQRDEWSKFIEFKNFTEWYSSANKVLNEDYKALWDATVDEMMKMLHYIQQKLAEGILDEEEVTLRDLGCFDPKVNGAGTVTSLVTIYLVSKYLSNPKSGLIRAVNLRNSDSDTIASMVGALLGALYGTDWIERDWFEVQDRTYLKRLVNSLFHVSINENKNENIQLWSESKNNKLKNNLTNIELNEELEEIGPFHKIKLIEKKELHTNIKNLHVTRYKFTTEFGQTIYMKKYSRYSK